MTTNQNDGQNEQNTQNENEQHDQNTISKEEVEAINTWFQSIRDLLQNQFPECKVEGQVARHAAYGPLLAYSLAKDGKSYATGFFLNELIHQFRNNSNPVLWVSSFFVDMLREETPRPLPAPPQTEEEFKHLVDNVIVPHCATSVREEFAPEEVHVDLDLHPEHGPVLEAGFPTITAGNNVVAMPLHLLIAFYLMNRDPSDGLIQGLYKIKEASTVKAEG
ncbi:hypothetical protein [Gorillibacterium massiliense]|uniref:hypothetical protein n=1 Tax=Gorillibacterium massiliense TaxID=1280390 RepID=UPI0004B4057D|nr:hypothetical protein [Gorillibacterium massiliense]